MKIFLLLLVACVTITSSANLNRNVRIIGGQSAVRNQFPYQLMVGTTVSEFHGGVLIARRWALTSAVFISTFKASDLQVFAGYLDRSDGTTDNLQRVDVNKIIIHPLFNTENSDYDIAIVQLSSLLIYGDNVQPITLIPKNYPEPTGLATMLGWGYTSTLAGTIAPGKLQYANVSIIDDTECTAQMNAKKQDLSYYNSTIKLCTIGTTSDDQQSACTEDGGGALVVDDYLVGIISWFTSECTNPTLHTKISAVRQWILDNTNGEIDE